MEFCKYTIVLLVTFRFMSVSYTQCVTDPAPWSFKIVNWGDRQLLHTLSPTDVQNTAGTGVVNFINQSHNIFPGQGGMITLEDTLCLDQDFTFDVFLRNKDAVTGQTAMAYDAVIKITLANGVEMGCDLVGLNQSWALNSTRLYFGTSSVTNNNNLYVNFNPPGGLGQINGFNNIRLKLQGNTVTFYQVLHGGGIEVENNALSVTLNGTICKTITKIDVWFKGAGEVDRIMVRDISLNTTYLDEDFRSCTNYSKFPSCTEPNYSLSFVAPNCNLDRLKINLGSVPQDSTQYSWTGPNGFTSNLKNPFVNNPSAAAQGTYTVSIKPKNPCQPNYTKSINVSFQPLPTPISRNITICSGQSFTLPDGVVVNQAGVYTSNIPSTVPGCLQTIVTTIIIGNIQAGSDISICSPGAVQLNAVSNGLGYKWEPSVGLSDTLIANPIANVSSNITYFVRSAMPDIYASNLIINNGFEMGNNSFVSQYNYSPNNFGTDLQYGIASSSQTATNQFQNCSPHSGNRMMVVNGGADSTQSVWCQSIQVQPNTFYSIGLWAQVVRNFNTAGTLQFTIDGNNIGSRMQLPIATCIWQEYSTFWYSGSNTVIDLCIKNVSNSNDPDFAIDDLWFKQMCEFSDSVQIQIEDISLDLVSQTSISCFGANDGAALVTSSGIAPIQYQWNNGNAGAQAINLTPGTHTVIVTDANGCTDTLEIMITEPTQLEDSLFTVQDIPCKGGFTEVFSNPSGGTAPYTYLWDDGTSAVSKSNAWVGAHSVQVKDANGCMVQSTTVILEPTELLVSITPPDAFCEGLSTTIQASASGGVGPYKIQWSNSKTSWSQTVSPLQTTSYTAFVTDNNNCTADNSTQITIYPNPIADFTYTPSSNVHEGDVVLFTNKSILSNSIEWYLHSGDVVYNKNEFTQLYEEEGEYCVELKATSSNGCTNSIEHCIEVQPLFTVFVPNSFTPNRDKINDVFRVVARSYVSMQMSVFDRWGNELIKLEGNQPVTIGWDGSYKGVPAPEGIYTYRLEVVDNNNKPYTYFGKISLIR